MTPRIPVLDTTSKVILVEWLDFKGKEKNLWASRQKELYN